MLGATHLIPRSLAAFVGTSANSGNQFSAAATFPAYPASITSDSPWAYLRGEETASSSVTSTAADSSGNGRSGTYDGQTNGPSTRWNFDEGTGTVADDSSGAANPGTLGAGATWTTAGHTGDAVVLNGTATGHVTGAAPAVSTDASFSVSAWVYLQSPPAGTSVVVSQAGGTSAGFELAYDGASQRWQFDMTQSDVCSPVVDYARSAAVADIGVWTHLVGVFDTSAVAGQQLKLYVDDGTPTAGGHTATWNASGALQVGRSQRCGGWVDYLAARVAEMSTYRRPLSAADVDTLYGDNPTTRWDFEEGSGATTADLSGNGNTGTLGSGASFATSGHTGKAVTFDGSSNAYVAGTTAAVDTAQSFTLTLWAYLTDKTADRTVVSIPGGTDNGASIKYFTSTDRWQFVASHSQGGTLDGAGTTSSTAAANTWVYLAGVYDATAGTLTLYIDGAPATSGPHSSSWTASGPLQLGRQKSGGAWQNPFAGTIDDVRTYQQALTGTQIANLYNPVAPVAMTAGIPGALQGGQQGLQATTAIAYAGLSNAYDNTLIASAPTAFTLECWFKASGSDGGLLMGFFPTRTGSSGTRDRLIYLDSGGRLTFGTAPSGTPVTIRSPAAYNDGSWHYVAASGGAAGLRLYVDGALVASKPATTTAAATSGYWRWGGGDPGSGWPNRPVNSFLTGTLDEVAFYSTQLSNQTVAWHYHANF